MWNLSGKLYSAHLSGIEKCVKNDSESGLHIKHQEFIHIFQQVHYMTINYIILYIYNSINTPHKSIQYNISVLEETLTSVLLGLSHIVRTWQGHNGTLKLCTLPGVDGSGAKGLATTAHCIGNSAQWRYGFLDRILLVLVYLWYRSICTKNPKDCGTTSLTSSLARAQNQFYAEGCWYANKNQVLHLLILLRTVI